MLWEVRKMRNRIISFAPATLGLALAFGGSTMSGGSARAEDECVAKPNTQSSQGGHWYYRTDRVNNRKCWYLRSDDGQVQQVAQDPSADTDDTAAAGETAPRATTAPVRTHIAAHGHRSAEPTASQAATVDAGPKPVRSRLAEQPAPAAPVQPSTGLAPASVPTNIPPFAAAWLWPGGAPAAASDAAPAPVQPTADVRAADAPAQSAPNAPSATPESQALAQRALTQLQTQRTAGDVQNPPTGGSAMEMLQKAFQRLTAPATPSAEPDHTLALLTSALALVTIGVGIFIAARWSMSADKRKPRPATWDVREDDISDDVISSQDMIHADRRDETADDEHWGGRETAARDLHQERLREQDLRAQNLREQSLREQTLRDQTLREQNLREQNMREQNRRGQDQYQRHAGNRPPHPLDDLAAAIAAVHDVRRVKVAADQQPRGPQPVQERLHQAYAPGHPETTARPRTGADTPVSTHAVEDTLRKMLQELSAKRSSEAAAHAGRAGVVHDLAAGRPPAAADQFGRHRNRTQRA